MHNNNNNNNNKPRRPNNAMGGGGQHRHHNNNNNNNRPRRFTGNRPQEGGNDAASVSRTRRTATQNREKYQIMAQGAQSAGDRVLTEYYLQHADHYHRVLLALPPEEAPRPQYLRGHNPNEQAQQAGDQPQQEANASMPQNDTNGHSQNGHPQNGGNEQHAQHAGQNEPHHSPAQHELPPFLTQPSNGAE